MKRILALLGCLTVQAAGQTYDFSRVDQYLDGVATRIPSGFELYILQNGKQIYWKQFGPWQKDTQAKIASATKWLSGAVIMSLVDDGTLSLDDRASRYLPYMSGEKAGITIRQLMSHTAGFGGEFPLVDPCLGDSSGTLDQCAQALAAVPLQVPAGTGFIYSGADMQIAGRVAEVASGKDWQTLFRERIAGPLGMTSTDYQYQGPTQNPRISGGGQSTVSDYMKFLTMIYQRGVFNGKRILSTRAVDVMLSDQVHDLPVLEAPGLPTWRYAIGNWVEDPAASGYSTRNSSTGLAGWTPMIDRSRNLQFVIGMQNAIRPFQPYYADLLTLLAEIIPASPLTAMGVTNSASFEAGPVAPGEVLALFGKNLGPGQSATATPPFPATLAGTQVTFDGVPAPLLYASAGQVSVVTPFEVAGKASVEVQVSYNGSKLAPVVLPVVAAWPALFAIDASGGGQGAVLNQDGSPNGASNPASVGSVLQMFGTGAGLTNPPSQNGVLQNGPGSLVEPVAVFIGGVKATVQYAGPAPTLVTGAFQVKAVVPQGVTPGSAVPVVIQAGPSVSTASITVAVK